MTRLRKTNRNKGWEKRHHAKQLSELHLTIEKMEQRAIGLSNAVLRERALVEEKAYEFASNMLKMRHLKEVLDRMAYEFSQADQKTVYEWMMRNKDLCLKYNLNSIPDAAKFIEYHSNQSRARSEGAKFRMYVDPQRRMKRIRLSFPALTYEMMVDDV